MSKPSETEYVQVLCGCGWGSLKMAVEDVPESCPVCGNPIGGEPDDEYYDRLADEQDDYAALEDAAIESDWEKENL